LTVEDRDGVALVRLSGEIDMSNTDSLAAEIHERVSNRALGAIVDLSGVDYIDSYGLGLLFDLGRRLGTRQQGLALVIPAWSHLRRLADLVELGSVVPLADSVEEARASLAGG
jgi:anti-anti-sigma factor